MDDMENNSKKTKIIIISVISFLLFIFIGIKTGLIIGFDGKHENDTIKVNEGSVTVINNKIPKGAKLETSDNDIIKIEDNKITGIKEGKAYITVTKGNKIVAEYEVIVEANPQIIDEVVNETEKEDDKQPIINETTTPTTPTTPTKPTKPTEEPKKEEPKETKPQTIEVKSVEILNNNETLTVGNKLKINYRVLPENASNKNVTWSSSNEKVVTIKNNEITAKSVGTATITVKTNNGKTDKININVISNEISVNSISLNLNNKTINVGETFTLTPSIQPSNATNVSITWTSNNTNVATISNGVVKGIKAGNAIITAKTNNGKTATCTVTVNEVAVSGINLDKTSASIKVNESITLNANVTPSNAANKTITWSSGDTSIATVSNGTVKGIKAGSATITAKTNNGKTATCTITVSNVEVTGVSLDKTSASVKINESVTLTANVTPSNAANKTITWSSSDTSVATVSNGTVKGIKAGSATITAKTNNGKTATCTITVTNDSCGTSKIHFMNTVESDAIIIESCGHFGLVDSSNPYNDGTAYSVSVRSQTVEHVIDYIKTITKCGSNCKGKLEFVIATHSHSDHVGGMPRIASTFVNSKTTYYYRQYVRTKEDDTTNWDNNGYYYRAYTAMKNAGAKMSEVTGKTPTISFYDLTIKLLNTNTVSSDELSGGIGVGENKNSIIQLVTHKNGTKVLLSADMETEDEARMKSKIGKVDVLKAGHHSYGSANSKSYIKTLKPDRIIITNNKFISKENFCYGTRINSNLKVFLTGNATDAVVLNYTDTSYSIKTQSGNNATTSNPCKSAGWLKDGCWYYYGSAGTPLKGWQELSWSGGKNWFYFKSDGCMLENTTQTINGKSYHFNSNGVCDSAGC